MSLTTEREQRRLNAIMATEDGRAWMWDHLAGCSVFHSTYTQDSHDTAFNEGRRSIGLRLIADIQEHAFKLYQKMEIEARARLDQELDEVENVDEV
jgi:hypothetical protein